MATRPRSISSQTTSLAASRRATTCCATCSASASTDAGRAEWPAAFYRRAGRPCWTSPPALAISRCALSRNLGPAGGANCVVSDICPAMLEVAKRRAGPLDQRQFKAARRTSTGDRGRKHRPLFDLARPEDLRPQARRWRRPARAEAGRDFVCLEASEIPVRWVHRVPRLYGTLHAGRRLGRDGRRRLGLSVSASRRPELSRRRSLRGRDRGSGSST